MISRGALALPVLAALSATAAAAHPLSPALLQVTESGPGRYQVVWKSAEGSPSPDGLDPRFPARCTAGARTVKVDPSSAAFVQRFQLDCGGRSLADEEIRVAGKFELNPEAVLTLRALDGQVGWAVLREQSPSFLVRRAQSAGAVLSAQLLPGFRQLVTRPEPWLLAVALFLLTKGLLPFLRAAAVLCAAQGLGLTLAALGVLRLPGAPLQATVGAGIALLAIQLARPAGSREASVRRHPWAVAAALGLLHGAGLAGGFAAAAPGDLPAALFGFNLGVAAGQLATAGLLAAAISAARRLRLLARRGPTFGHLALGSLAVWISFAGIARFWTETRP